jgi:hypothetical protein
VQHVDGKLKLVVSKELTAELEHRHVDTFMAVWSKRWRGEGLVTFQLHPMTGEVVSITSFGQTFRRQTK